MPKKLAMVCVVLAVSLAVDVAIILAGNPFVIADLVIGALLLWGLVKGSDGARTFVTFIAWTNLVMGAAFPLFALTQGRHMPAPAVTAALLIVAAVRVAANAFTIWSLRQSDVRDWMFRRAFHLDAGQA